jgi:hypothetical protein
MHAKPSAYDVDARVGSDLLLDGGAWSALVGDIPRSGSPLLP